MAFYNRKCFLVALASSIALNSCESKSEKSSQSLAKNSNAVSNMRRNIPPIDINSLSGTTSGQSRSDMPLDTLLSALGAVTGILTNNLIKLPQYEVNPCLSGLLDDIIRNDESCNNEIGYYFSESSIEGKTLLNISPANISRLPFAKFMGYFIYGERIFLCYGKNHYYISRMSPNKPLTLRAYIAEYPRVSDCYLGGDTNGVLKIFSCDSEEHNVLIKTCISPAEHKARRQ